MKKKMIAAAFALVTMMGLGVACNKSTCVGTSCTTVECKPDEISGWCRVEITTVNPVCLTEQPFGFCVKLPKNGFPPNTDLNNFIWRGAQEPIRELVKQGFGVNAGFTLEECKAADTNPFKYDVNSFKPDVLVELKGEDGNSMGRHPRDEAQCESCAGAICNLNQCGADANCSCWVKCAFADATLASCPSMCGAQGGVTQSLVQCLVQDCGVACGVSSDAPMCNGSTGTGTQTSCGQTGDICGYPGNPDCCGFCGLDNLCE